MSGLVLVGTVVLMAINVYQIRAFRRKLHDQTALMLRLEVKEREMEARLEHVATLDILLTRLCSATLTREIPAWRAWDGTMGSVTVDMQRNFPTEEE